MSPKVHCAHTLVSVLLLLLAPLLHSAPPSPHPPPPSSAFFSEDDVDGRAAADDVCGSSARLLLAVHWRLFFPPPFPVQCLDARVSLGQNGGQNVVIGGKVPTRLGAVQLGLVGGKQGRRRFSDGFLGAGRFEDCVAEAGIFFESPCTFLGCGRATPGRRVVRRTVASWQ